MEQAQFVLENYNAGCLEEAEARQQLEALGFDLSESGAFEQMLDEHNER